MGYLVHAGAESKALVVRPAWLDGETEMTNDE